MALHGLNGLGGRPVGSRGGAIRPWDQSGAADGGRDIDDPSTTFGELLSCMRLAVQLSQTALARAAGVNASYLNRLESGEWATPTHEVVVALARALDATPTERDQLLWLAGHLPQRLQQLAAADATLTAVLNVLTGEQQARSARRSFRSLMEGLAELCQLPARAAGASNG